VGGCSLDMNADHKFKNIFPTQFVCRIACLLVFALSLITQVSQAEPLKLEDVTSQSLTTHLSYQLESPPFPDLAGVRLNSARPLQVVLDGPFAKVTTNSFNLGYTGDRAWVWFSVHNPYAERVERYLTTGQRYMRPFVFYEQDESGQFAESFYNDQFQPFSERPMAVPNLVLPLTFEPRETREFLIFVGAAGALSLDLALAEPNWILQENTQALISAVFVCGILLALVLTNLLHYAALRRPANLFYALMEISIGVYLMHMEGFAFQYLWPNWVAFNEVSTGVTGSVSNILGSLFMIYFLELHRNHRRLILIPLGYIAVSAISLLLLPFLDLRYINEMGILATSTGPLIFVGVGVYVYLQGNRSALFFVLGWLVLGTGNILFGATASGLIDLPVVSFDWIRLGTLGEALLLSWGLSDQVRRLNAEYSESQAQLVANLEARLIETSERLELETKVDQGERKVAEMDRRLATTSHDVGQPIYALRLSLMALTNKIEDSSVLENLNRTLDNMELVLEDNLQSYSTNEVLLPTSLGELFRDICDSLDQEALSRGVVLKSVYTAKSVNEDLVVPLRRVIQNLVANAIRHANASKVLIGLRRTASNTQVHIIDNGDGLPDKGVRAVTSGTGLGLSIVREICQKQNWGFEVLNHPGEGVHFRVTIHD